MDIDAAGGAITAGTVAGAIEKPTGHAGASNHGACSDCGAETSGNFCANCGQATHVHRSLLHLGEELLHGVMHFDARIWRTLPLLAFNPGKLTREWVEGRRTRYVSPLAMFLFTVFVMFFALSFMPQPDLGGEPVTPERLAAQREAVAQSERTLTELRAELTADLGADPAGQAVVDSSLATAERVLDSQRAQLTRMEAELAGGRTDGLKSGSWQAQLKDLAAEDQASRGEDAHGFGPTLLKKLQNPDLAIYKLQQTMYKFAFLLVPLSIPFVALLFLWRRGFTLYDHGVFVLYSLTFMAMLLMVMVVAGTIAAWLGGLAVTVGMLAIPVHMFAQLKGAYGLGVFSALWRAAMLLVFCSVAIGLFVTAIVYLGLGM